MTGSDIETGLTAFFEQDHRDCDARWADVEELLDTDDVEAALPAWQKYEAGMRRHLAMEDEVLFPAFESASGQAADGPTAAMRMEHRQMEGMLDKIAEAIESGNAHRALDAGDTLLMLIQQHNINEETVIYPLAEELLGARWPELLARLSQY